MSIARNTLVTAFGALATMAVTVLTVPLFIKLIGLERYGVLAIMWTTLTYFGLVELGVSGAMVQRLASGMLSPAKRISLYWTGFTMNSVMGLVGGAILGLSFDWLISTMSFSTQTVEIETRSTGWIVALMILVMTVRAVNNGVLYGAERFVAMATLSTLETIASAVVPLVVAAYFSLDLYWLMLSILVVRLLFLLISFIVMLPGLPGFRITRGSVSQARDLVSFGFWLWLMGVLNPLLTYFDRFLVGNVLGVAQLPYYSVPQAVVEQASHIPRALGSVLFPRFAGVPNDVTAATLTLRALDSMRIVITPISVLSILLIEPLLTVWLTRDFASKSCVVAAVLLASLLPSALARVVISQLNGRNKPHLVVRAQLIELVPYAVLLYFLSIKLGLVGVAIVWSLRVLADALLLGYMARVSLPMLSMLCLPALMVGASMAISFTQGMYDPWRWVEAFVLAVLVMVWACLYMPADLVRLLSRVPLMGYLPAGRWNRAP